MVERSRVEFRRRHVRHRVSPPRGHPHPRPRAHCRDHHFHTTSLASVFNLHRRHRRPLRSSKVDDRRGCRAHGHCRSARCGDPLRGRRYLAALRVCIPPRHLRDHARERCPGVHSRNRQTRPTATCKCTVRQCANRLDAIHRASTWRRNVQHRSLSALHRRCGHVCRQCRSRRGNPRRTCRRKADDTVPRRRAGWTSLSARPQGTQALDGDPRLRQLLLLRRHLPPRAL